MAEPIRTSALSGHLDGLPGGGEDNALRIAELRPGAIAQIMGAPEPEVLTSCLAVYALDSAPGSGRCARGEQMKVLCGGPNQYLVVSGQHEDEALTHSLGIALDGQGSAVVDLSHARTVLRIQGPHCRDVLAKGCPVDVDAMVAGDTAATVLGHFNILLHCEAGDAFEIYVFRSFGLACFEWLWAAGREFGMVLASDVP